MATQPAGFGWPYNLPELFGGMVAEGARRSPTARRFAGLPAESREIGYGFERQPSGALESQQPGYEAFPEAEARAMIARLLDDRPGPMQGDTSEKESPALLDIFTPGAEASPAEAEMDAAFKRYQENPEQYAAETYKRPMFPGEIRVGLGGEESLRTYNPSAGLGKEFAATRISPGNIGRL